MRVLHLMLSCFYIDNAHYQENLIPKMNKEDGHEVLIIASTEIFVKNNILGTTEPSSYINENGIKVIRVPYLSFLNKKIAIKVRAYEGVYKRIQEFAPDVILFHGGTAYALNDVAKYKRHYPHVKLFVDSHEDFNNSARGFVSKYILHSFFYKRILLSNLKYVEKVLYITKETYNFLKYFYKIPEEKLLFFPLGGIIPDVRIRENIRYEIRKELNLSENDILCVHSGKLDKLKRTDEILKGFSSHKSNRFKLIIIGSVDRSYETRLNEFLTDNRIQFLGWKKGDELQKYLMASDLYLQLGTQSATMQLAICNGCVVAVYPHESHTFLLNDACYYISNENEITDLLCRIEGNEQEFAEKRRNLKHIATHVLDYEVISKLIFQ